MSDKRQEFVEKWATFIAKIEGGPDYLQRVEWHKSTLDKILTEYDKLKSDKWERLRKFILTDRDIRIIRENNKPEGRIMITQDIDAETSILAEISRLEKEETVSDKWERLKEFVREAIRVNENRYDDGSMGRCDEAQDILAEIERLEAKP